MSPPSALGQAAGNHGFGLSSAGEEQGAPVRLNVYDLGVVGKLVNGKEGSLARSYCLGLFHCAVEVHGSEYAFMYYWNCWEEDRVTGVIRSPPRADPIFGAGYRETLELGRTTKSPAEVAEVLQTFCLAWRSNTYHLIGRNCVTFAEELASRLEVGSVPRWVGGLGGVAQRTPPLRLLVNAVWRLIVVSMVLMTRETQQIDEDLDCTPPPDLASALHAGPLAMAAALALDLVRPAPLRAAAAAATLAASWLRVCEHPFRWLEQRCLLALSACLTVRGLALGQGTSSGCCALGAAACVAMHAKWLPGCKGVLRHLALLGAQLLIAAAAALAL